VPAGRRGDGTGMARRATDSPAGRFTWAGSRRRHSWVPTASRLPDLELPGRRLSGQPCLPDGSGDEHGDELGGMPVQRGPGPLWRLPASPGEPPRRPWRRFRCLGDGPGRWPAVDGTFICTPSHDQRPRFFSTALLHGYCRCRPEPRSIAGGRLDLLEAATTVTECDWTLSHGRAW